MMGAKIKHKNKNLITNFMTTGWVIKMIIFAIKMVIFVTKNGNFSNKNRNFSSLSSSRKFIH